jgi:hypothetical protein
VGFMIAIYLAAATAVAFLDVVVDAESGVVVVVAVGSLVAEKVVYQLSDVQVDLVRFLNVEV